MSTSPTPQSSNRFQDGLIAQTQALSAEASVFDVIAMVREAAVLGTDVEGLVLGHLKQVPRELLDWMTERAHAFRRAAALLANPVCGPAEFAYLCRALKVTRQSVGLVAKDEDSYDFVAAAIHYGHLVAGSALHQGLVQFCGKGEATRNVKLQRLVIETPGLAAADVADWWYRNRQQNTRATSYVFGQANASIAVLQDALRAAIERPFNQDLPQDLEVQLLKGGHFARWQKGWTEYLVGIRPGSGRLAGLTLAMAWRHTAPAVWPNRPYCRKVLTAWRHAVGDDTFVVELRGAKIPDTVWPWIGREILGGLLKSPDLQRDSRVEVVRLLGLTTARPEGIVPARRPAAAKKTSPVSTAPRTSRARPR